MLRVTKFAVVSSAIGVRLILARIGRWSDMSDASMYESTTLEVLLEKMFSIRVEEVVVILVGCVIEGKKW
jgi:hypothetical protein